MKTVDITNFVAWLESRRKFSKIMMELAIQERDKKDEQYYLGRMNEAKLIKQHLKSRKTITSVSYSNRVKKGWETRRKNQEKIELEAKYQKDDTLPPYPAGPTK